LLNYHDSSLEDRFKLKIGADHDKWLGESPRHRLCSPEEPQGFVPPGETEKPDKPFLYEYVTRVFS
jgi:hypothetical protein